MKQDMSIAIRGSEMRPCRLRSRGPNRRILPKMLLAAWFFLAIVITAMHAYSNDSRTGAVSTGLADLLSPKMPDQFLFTADFEQIAGEDRESTPALPPAAADSQGNARSAAATQRWSSFLPIWGEEAREKGHKLPPPFGVAASFFYGYRDINVDSVDVDIRNFALAVDRLANIDVKSEERNWSMRLDAWLFPFLNLYLLAGYTEQHSDVGCDLNLRAAPLLQFVFPRHTSINLDLDGTTYGGGSTLVGGYKQFYMAVDGNYTFSNLKGDLNASSTFDQTVDALLISTRLGWRTGIGAAKINLWIGGTYWGIAQTVDGDVKIPLLGTVDFEVEESPARTYSAHMGTHVEFTEQVNFTFDIGSNFSDMLSIVPALSYRF